MSSPPFLNAVGQSLPPDPLTKIHVKNSIYSSGLQAPSPTFQKHIFQRKILSLLKLNEVGPGLGAPKSKAGPNVLDWKLPDTYTDSVGPRGFKEASTV